MKKKTEYLIIFHGDYLNNDAVKNVINYICRPTDAIFNMYGIRGCTPEKAVEDIRSIYEYCGYPSEALIHHFCITFQSNKNKEYLFWFADRIASLFSQKYQIVFSLHPLEKHSGYHIHFAVAAVSYLPDVPELNSAELEKYYSQIITYAAANGIHIEKRYKNV